MALATEKKKPSTKLSDYTVLLYGTKMIGKSSLLAQVPDNLFLNSGGGLEAIECYQEYVPKWEDFLSIGAEFIAGQHNFKAITFDTIDRMHKMCSDYMMDKLKITHPGDLAFGKGWDLVKSEFLRPIMKLVLSNYQVFFISHSKDIEVTTRTLKITKHVPSMSDGLYGIVSSMSGIILYYDTEETSKGSIRLLRTSPTEKWIAGDRTKKLQEVGDIVMEPPPADNWSKLLSIFNGETKK